MNIVAPTLSYRPMSVGGCWLVRSRSGRGLVTVSDVLRSVEKFSTWDGETTAAND